MDIGVIVSGKPSDTFCKASHDLPGDLVEGISDGIFKLGNSIKTDVMLIDIRNYENMWYSVYSYILPARSVNGYRGNTFFVVSFVIKAEYSLYVRGVYALLNKACREYAKEKYLDDSYMFKDASCNSADWFNDLQNKIFGSGEIKDFVLKPIDENFACKKLLESVLDNIPSYNVDDSDTEDLLQSLKTQGRVAVCESEVSMKKELENLRQQIENLGKDLETKKNELETLRKVQQPVGPINKKEPEERNSSIKNKLDSIIRKLDELNGKKQKGGGVSKPAKVGKNSKHIMEILPLLPVINTLLLLVVILLTMLVLIYGLPKG